MSERTCSADGCGATHYAKGLCRPHYRADYRRRHGRNRQAEYFDCVCARCGRNFRSSRRTGKFCSDVCKGASYRRVAEVVGPIEPTFSVLPDQHPARQTVRPARVWIAGFCAWCEQSFVFNQPQARYCSERCSSNYHRAKRGRFVVQPRRRLAIYERDGWTCQLCLEPVDRDLMTLDPSNDWAPSLDHIECQAWALIPDHSDANLRLAHRWCNAVRGDGRYYSESDLRVCA